MTPLRRNLLLGALAVGAGAGSGALVEGLRAPRVVTVTEYKDRVVEHTVTVEKPVVEYRDRVVVRTVTKPDGTKVETHVEDKTSKNTGEKTTTVASTETKAGSSSVTQAPEGRWSVRALAGVDTRGSVLAGAGLEYRLLGPLTVGGWATGAVAGPGVFAAGVSLGLRLP